MDSGRSSGAVQRNTFLGFPGSDQVIRGSVSILGAAHGTEYRSQQAEPRDEEAPDVVRRAITAASLHAENWDFDFDGPLLNDGKIAVFDLGNVETRPASGSHNREAIEAATRKIRSGDSLPILIGGDDSVAVPFMRAFDDLDAMHVLQIDAHIDWRDTVDGEAEGYSSTMRRASELPFVRSMTQVGIRAVGSARREDVEAARAWGSRLVTIRELRALGPRQVIASIPNDVPLLIHLDCDALDPSICPGVNATSPGGLWLDEVTDIIAAAMTGRTLTGFSIVEYNPTRDVNDITAITVGRLVCHVIGQLARQGRV